MNEAFAGLRRARVDRDLDLAAARLPDFCSKSKRSIISHRQVSEARVVNALGDRRVIRDTREVPPIRSSRG